MTTTPELQQYLLGPSKGPGDGFPAVNVHAGSWYPDDASIRYWPLQDRALLPEAGGTVTLFNIPYEQNGKEPSATNLEVMPVPGNEAWYLWGIRMYIMSPFTSARTSANRALIQGVINGAQAVIKLPQEDNYRTTLSTFFGGQQFSQANATPVVSQSQPAGALYDGKEAWALPLVYQANSRWKMEVTIPERVPGVATLYLGVELDRVIASLVPA